MRRGIAHLLSEIAASESSGAFAVRRLDDGSCYFAGRDADGCAALLIDSIGQGRVPLRLAGIEARFAVQCRIAEPGIPETSNTLTVIVCLSRDPSIETYFAGILDSLITLLGPAPTTDQINDAVDQLVELFQKLQQPARRSLIGLAGELCIILLAANAPAAIDAWRIDPDERFDFLAGSLRLDVKSSSNRRRSHEVSFEQANPPPGTTGLFASIWIEQAGGGFSLSQLLGRIEERLLSSPHAVSKLWAVVGDTLGSALPAAMSWRFDLPLAEASLLFFEAARIPALRPPLAVGLSAARFVSDFAQTSPSPVGALRTSLGSAEAVLFPP